jgi:preprotein translocase subunit YajC
MQPNPGLAIAQLFPLIFLLIVFYLLLIRPQKKKQEAHRKMIESLKKNDEVVTIGGIHGTIVNVKDKTFVLRVDDNVKIEVDKPSVSYVKRQRKDD